MAWRALRPLHPAPAALPITSDFPFTIVSESGAVARVSTAGLVALTDVITAPGGSWPTIDAVLSGPNHTSVLPKIDVGQIRKRTGLDKLVGTCSIFMHVPAAG